MSEKGKTLFPHNEKLLYSFTHFFPKPCDFRLYGDKVNTIGPKEEIIKALQIGEMTEERSAYWHISSDKSLITVNSSANVLLSAIITSIKILEPFEEKEYWGVIRQPLYINR